MIQMIFQTQTYGGSKFKAENVKPCQKPWNVPLMSINRIQPDTYVEYSSQWTVLMATVLDTTTVVYANKVGNDESSFLLVSRIYMQQVCFVPLWIQM